MEKQEANHTINLCNKEQLEVTGVTAIVSYNEEEVKINTELGGLIVTGSGLQVLGLDLDEGRLEVVGEVAQLTYTGPDLATKSRGFLDNLFR